MAVLMNLSSRAFPVIMGPAVPRVSLGFFRPLCCRASGDEALLFVAASCVLFVAVCFVRCGVFWSLRCVLFMCFVRCVVFVVFLFVCFVRCVFCFVLVDALVCWLRRACCVLVVAVFCFCFLFLFVAWCFGRCDVFCIALM